MSIEELKKRIISIEERNQILEKELKKYKKKPVGLIAYVLLNIGIILLFLSMAHQNQIFAIIGIAMTFWGSLLLYIRPTRFMSKDIFNSISVELLKSQEYLFGDITFHAHPQYISPPTLRDSKNVVLYVYNSDSSLPPDFEYSNDTLFSKGPSGINVRPLGLELSKLLENELSTNFLLNDIEYLSQNLGKVIVDNLEMAKSFSFETLDDKIKVIIKDNIFETFIERMSRNQGKLYFVDPLTSSIACIIAIVSGKSVMIDLYDWNLKDKLLTVNFSLENIEQ